MPVLTDETAILEVITPDHHDHENAESLEWKVLVTVISVGAVVLVISISVIICLLWKGTSKKRIQTASRIYLRRATSRLSSIYQDIADSDVNKSSKMKKPKLLLRPRGRNVMLPPIPNTSVDDTDVTNGQNSVSVQKKTVKSKSDELPEASNNRQRPRDVRPKDANRKEKSARAQRHHPTARKGACMVKCPVDLPGTTRDYLTTSSVRPREHHTTDPKKDECLVTCPRNPTTSDLRLRDQTSEMTDTNHHTADPEVDEFLATCQRNLAGTATDYLTTSTVKPREMAGEKASIGHHTAKFGVDEYLMTCPKNMPGTTTDYLTTSIVKPREKADMGHHTAQSGVDEYLVTCSGNLPGTTTDHLTTTVKPKEMAGEMADMCHHTAKSGVDEYLVTCPRNMPGTTPNYLTTSTVKPREKADMSHHTAQSGVADDLPRNLRATV